MTTGPAPRCGDRFLGRHRGSEPGPTVLCLAGVHGNEPAGLVALRRVFDELHRLRPAFAGDGSHGMIAAAVSSGGRHVRRSEDVEMEDLCEPRTTGLQKTCRMR